MIQHIARGLFGATIVDPKNSKAWAKADREYVLVQSECFKNPDDVQAMFDRMYDNVHFNGGIFKYTRSSRTRSPVRFVARLRYCWWDQTPSQRLSCRLRGEFFFLGGTHNGSVIP